MALSDDSFLIHCSFLGLTIEIKFGSGLWDTCNAPYLIHKFLEILLFYLHWLLSIVKPKNVSDWIVKLYTNDASASSHFIQHNVLSKKY